MAQAPAEELPPGEVDLSRVEIPTELTAPGAEADLVDAAAPVGMQDQLDFRQQLNGAEPKCDRGAGGC